MHEYRMQVANSFRPFIMQFRLTRCYDVRFVQDVIGFNSCNARRDLRLGIIKEIKKPR